MLSLLNSCIRIKNRDQVVETMSKDVHLTLLLKRKTLLHIQLEYTPTKQEQNPKTMDLESLIG